jgi:hypothetical protein
VASKETCPRTGALLQKNENVKEKHKAEEKLPE